MKRQTDARELRREELENCGFVRTVLMLLVVVYHAMLAWNGKWFSTAGMARNEVLAGLAGWLNTVHIYGFTLVSGYMFHFTRHERGKAQRYGALLRGKARRLLLPYAFVAVAWVIPHDICFNGFDATRLTRDYLLAESPQQLWFLWMLMIVFAVFGLVSDFVRRHEAGGLLLVGALYCVGFVGRALLPDVFQVWTGCRYVLYFWLGFKLRQHGTQWLRRLPGPVWLALHVGLYLLGSFIPEDGSVIVKLASIGFSALIRLMGGLMAFMALQWLARRIRWQENRVLCGLQRCAMPVYLFHQQVVFWLLLLLKGLLPPGVHALVNFAGALLISAGLSWMLMRFRLTRTLIGEK